MTLRNVLDLLDHEVWVRVRPYKNYENPADDAVFWSADWIGGGVDDPFIPKEIKTCLDWEADDLSIETHPNPEDGEDVPMLVVNAYKN